MNENRSIQYDLIVIGSGPSGQKAAIAAAKLGKRVAIVEKQNEKVGGVCLHTGTIPSKTLREAIIYLTGYRQRDVYAERYQRKRHITMSELKEKLNQVIKIERRVIRDQLERNLVDVYEGEGQFVDRHTLDVVSTHSSERLHAERFLIATGTRPSRPANIPFDGTSVFDSDEILRLDNIPASMIVVGGGVIGLEYAIMFAALGVKVTVVDGRSKLLEFCDEEIIETLMFCCRSMGIVFRLGENVDTIRKMPGNRVAVELESRKRLVAETVFFSVGRVGETDHLNVAAIGLTTDKRGKVSSNSEFRTEVDNVYAVGDVIGFPSLASTSIEQGRCAVMNIFGHPYEYSELIPFGLYTIPEISMVGKTEKQLTEEKTPFEIGVARFDELAKSQICGETMGMLKLLFHRETHQLLGVHCIGDSATEIIHIGQTVMAFGGKIDHFCNNVFNHPTIAEAYKVAAFDGLNRVALCDEVDAFCQQAEDKQAGEAGTEQPPGQPEPATTGTDSPLLIGQSFVPIPQPNQPAGNA